MIERKKYTSNCMTQSYLTFLRFVQTQLNSFSWSIDFSIHKIFIKIFEVTRNKERKFKAFKITLYYPIQYTFPINASTKWGRNSFHINYSLQNAKNQCLYCTHIVAIRTRRTENAVLVNLNSIAGTHSWGLNRLYKLAVSGKGTSEEDRGFLTHTMLSAPWAN